MDALRVKSNHLDRWYDNIGWYPSGLAIMVISTMVGCQSMATGGGGLWQPGDVRYQSYDKPVTQSPVDQGLQNTPQLLADTGPQEEDERDRSNMVADVLVKGNSVIPTHHVLNNIRTRPDRFFDPDLLKQDIDQLWKMKAVRRINGPFLEKTPDGIVITIEIVERKMINSVRFVGNRAITDRTLGRQTDLKSGQPLDVHQIRMARQQIEDYYRENGFPRTQVTIVNGDENNDRDVVFLIHEDQKQRVYWVEFEGNTFVSGSRLRSFVDAKPAISGVLKGFGLDRSDVDKDIARLTAYYRAYGFFNARISREFVESQSGEWVRIKYVIDEGPRYKVRNVSFIGNQKYTREQLISMLELKPDDSQMPDFKAGEMNSDVNTLRDLYGSEGHVFAGVEAEPRFLEEPGMLDLVYKIEEGKQYRAGKINIHIDGDHGITKRQTVLSRMDIQPGDIIDIRKIRDSERHLSSSRVFADGSPGTGPPPKVVVKPNELQQLEQMAEQHSSDTMIK